MKHRNVVDRHGRGKRPGFGRRAVAAWVLVGAGLTAAAPASADSCREWAIEHADWKAEAVRRYLDGSPADRLDTAIFELLQREAYLTSCELPVARARERFVGWRLVGRTADEYGRAVMESVLAESGMDLEVRNWFGSMLAAPAPRPDAFADERAALPPAQRRR